MKYKDKKKWKNGKLKQNKIENYERLQYLMQGGDPYTLDYHMQNGYTYNPEFIYQDDIRDGNGRMNIEYNQDDHPNYQGCPPIPPPNQLHGKWDMTCQTQTE